MKKKKWFNGIIKKEEKEDREKLKITRNFLIPPPMQAKYQKPPLGLYNWIIKNNDIGIRKFEFEAETQFLTFLDEIKKKVQRMIEYYL